MIPSIDPSFDIMKREREMQRAADALTRMSPMISSIDLGLETSRQQMEVEERLNRIARVDAMIPSIDPSFDIMKREREMQRAADALTRMSPMISSIDLGLETSRQQMEVLNNYFYSLSEHLNDVEELRDDPFTRYVIGMLGKVCLAIIKTPKSIEEVEDIKYCFETLISMIQCLPFLSKGTKIFIQYIPKILEIIRDQLYSLMDYYNDC